MRVIVFQQHPLDILPPLISLMRILLNLGHDVWYVGLSDTKASFQILEEIGVPHRIYNWPIVKFHDQPFVRLRQKLLAPISHFIFRRWAWEQIKPLMDETDESVLWVQSMNSASILGNRILPLGKRCIVSLYDLGDEYGRDLPGFDIKALYKSATLIECEYNRAQILMAEKGLDRVPFVLPNKPFPHPRTRDINVLDPAVSAIVRSWKGRKVFLYQGALQSDRGDLFAILCWLCEALPDSVIAVMGQKNSMVEKMLKEYDNFSFVPFVPPPHHLEVTSYADIGIAIYKGGSVYGLSPLNAIYCAPNKIFEYTGFGMPVLCNDIPGLRYTIGVSQAGICLEDISQDSVCGAARRLIAEYDLYSGNATKFFESVDTIGTVKSILNYARSEVRCEKRFA